MTIKQAWQHKIPVISEVNLEIRDFTYYFQKEIVPENLKFNFSADARFLKGNIIHFFIHIRIGYRNSPKNQFNLYHTDFLSQVEVRDNQDWSEMESLEVDQTFLSHILGMSILMIRGHVSQRLGNNPLGKIPLPIINPLNLLREKLEADEKNSIFIIHRHFKGVKSHVNDEEE